MTYFTFDSDEKTISGPGGTVNLATQEVKILSALLAKPGEVVPGLEMDRALYGKGAPPFGALGVRLRRLRVKLESIGLPDVINTVRGVGLRWVGPV